MQEMLNLSQQDYVKRIEDLNLALTNSWDQDQRVKALKIAIQVRSEWMYVVLHEHVYSTDFKTDAGRFKYCVKLRGMMELSFLCLKQYSAFK